MATITTGNILEQTNQYLFNFEIANPGEGTYNIASTTMMQDVFNAGVNPSISITNDADPFNAWSASFDGAGSIGLSHGDFGYTVWDTETISLGGSVATSGLEQNGQPGHQSFTAADIGLPSWNPSNYDSILVKSDNPLFSAPNYTGSVTPGQLGTFTAVDQGGFNTFEGQAPAYAIANPNDFSAIPEPATTALLALGLGYAALTRKRK